MSRIIKQIPTDATDFEIDVNGNDFLSIDQASPDSGAYATGILTFEARTPGSDHFQALSPNILDLETPLVLKIENQPVEAVRVTVTGYTGTATAINLALNDWGVIRK